MVRSLVFFVVVIILVVSCASQKQSARKFPDIQIDPHQTGGALILNSDCTTCHNTSEKFIGPAFIAVALKYDSTQANIDRLVRKIQMGGSGNWGTVPMTPHRNLPETDITEIVKYILSLKKFVHE